MIRSSRAALVVALFALTISACRGQQAVVTPVDSPRAPQPPVNPAGNSNNTPTNNRARDDSLAAHAAAVTATRSSLVETLYFAYDAFELDADAKANLDMKVRIMQANPGVRIRIEGHCDNRGSTEYNIALGQRRAATARQYLVDHGIQANRIETVSLGEERPAVQGDNEAAWAKNRRDQFSIISGTIDKPVGN